MNPWVDCASCQSVFGGTGRDIVMQEGSIILTHVSIIGLGGRGRKGGGSIYLGEALFNLGLIVK